MARPTLFTKQFATEICHRVSLGRSVRDICKDDDMPAMSTVFLWLAQNKEFSEQYARAKQLSTDVMAEDIINIADENTDDWMTVGKGQNEREIVNREAVERSKLRVHTRQWLMERMKPQKYGKSIDLTTKGEKLPTPILSGASAAIIPTQNEENNVESAHGQENSTN